MCLARIFAAIPLVMLHDAKFFFSQSTCLARMYSANLGCMTRVRREWIARVVPQKFIGVTVKNKELMTVACACFNTSLRSKINLL